MKKKLIDLKVGQTGTVTQISPNLQAHINSIGIRTNKTLTLTAINPAGGPYVVSTNNNTISLGRKLCKEIHIEVDN